MVKAEAAESVPPPAPEADEPRTDRPAVSSCSTATGQGLTTAVARKLSRFSIEACAADRMRCRQGGLHFTVTITGAALVRARVTDKEDGTYVVEYKAPSSGQYSVSVLLHGAPLPGSPWRLEVVMPRPDAAQSTARGDALSRTIAAHISAFEVAFVDALGQSTCAPGESTR
jgi:hypothetical protein